mmetsp:Transcript_14279/g.20877  ORF Transcript_14279/g.20877 Transcript_14279/m.20877 type:complete len:86 (+) Transcript_14279:27-284(+)
MSRLSTRLPCSKDGIVAARALFELEGGEVDSLQDIRPKAGVVEGRGVEHSVQTVIAANGVQTVPPRELHAAESPGIVEHAPEVID